MFNPLKVRASRKVPCLKTTSELTGLIPILTLFNAEHQTRKHERRQWGAKGHAPPGFSYMVQK